MKKLVVILLVLLGGVTFGQNKKELKEAEKLFKQENYEEAFTKYQKFLTIDPTNVDFAYKYGCCLVMLNKDNSKAIEYLENTRKMGKTDREVSYFLGRAYENKQDYDKAIEEYEKFMEVADKSQIKQLKIKKRVKSCKKARKSNK